MVSYAEMDSLIGKLKRAAIDAKMASDFREGGSTCHMTDSHYNIRTTFQGNSTTEYITRPGKNGQGGGKWTSDAPGSSGMEEMNTRTYIKEFNAVRNAIDTLLEPWMDLPSPEGIKGMMVECRMFTQVLSFESKISNGVLIGSGVIDRKISSIQNRLDDMSGETVQTFTSNVVHRIGPVVQGLCSASYILGGALGAEWGIFLKARQAIADVVDDATKMFNDVAKRREGALETVLKIVSMISEGVSIFSAGVAGKAVSSLGFGLKSMQKLDEEEIDEDSATYDTAMKALRDAVGKVNKSITKSEKAVQQYLIDNLHVIYSGKPSFDITIDPIESSELSKSEILNIDEAKVGDIAKFMPEISEELNNAINRLIPINMDTCVNRNAKIGLGVSGPSHSFNNFKWLIHDLIKELSWDIKNSSKNFELAVEYIMDQDLNIKKELDEFATTMKTGSDANPWRKRK